MEPALRLQRISKSFGEKRAVHEMDLVVPRGATYGFIGPSGAGKTTCIRMIMSILFPDSGELSVLGHRSALEAKDRIGYLPEERGVYRRMKVGDFLTFIAQLKGVPEEEALPRALELLKRTGLVDVEKKKCEELSKGMLHRVEFVAAIINRPELIILDEPMTGLRRQFDPRVIRVEPLDENASVAVLRQVPGVAEVKTTNDGWEVHLQAGIDPTTAMQQIAATVPVASIAMARLRLEDVFLRLVAADAQGTEAERALRANLQGVGEGAVA